MTPDKIAASGSESAQQKALFAWAAMARHFGFEAAFAEAAYRGALPANLAGAPVPELEWLHAIPNGGKRDAVTASKLKGEGVRKGVSDISWPLARGGYHGLYVEMKVADNKETPEQIAFGGYLTAQGFAYVVCYDWRSAANLLRAYYADTVRNEHPAPDTVRNVWA